MKIRGLIIEEKIDWLKIEDAQSCVLRLKFSSKVHRSVNFEDQRLKIGMLTLKI